MAYNTKAIKTDVNAKPIPQYYNPVTDEYEVLHGRGGAARQVLYGPDGQPISTTGGKLAVRAAELEAKIEAVRVLLNALAGKDFATQTTLAQILAKMIASPATEAKQDALAEKIDGILDGTTPATTQLKGSLIADEEAVPVKRVGREYASNTSSPLDNQEVPAGSFVNYRVDLKGYGHVVSSVVTSESAPNTNGNYKAINELGSLWGTSVGKDYTARNFTSEPLQILGDTVAFRYQNNSEAPVVILRLRYYAF